jgi:hypothetical protein
MNDSRVRGGGLRNAAEPGLQRQIFFCQLGGFDTHQGVTITA